MTNTGTVLTINAPFIPDYFARESTGLAGSYLQVTITAA